MAIKLKHINGKLVALCAAKQEGMDCDIYLDDNIHHALTRKFTADFIREGLFDRQKPTMSISEVEVVWKKHMGVNEYGTELINFAKFVEAIKELGVEIIKPKGETNG